MPESLGSWTTKAPMPTARAAPAVGVVHGILYAVGGNSNCCQLNTVPGELNTVESYNPATDTWTTKASMPTSRPLLASGVINARRYAVGGTYTGHVLNTVEAFNPR